MFGMQTIVRHLWGVHRYQWEVICSQLINTLVAFINFSQQILQKWLQDHTILQQLPWRPQNPDPETLNLFFFWFHFYCNTHKNDFFKMPLFCRQPRGPCNSAPLTKISPKYFFLLDVKSVRQISTLHLQNCGRRYRWQMNRLMATTLNVNVAKF